MSTSSDKGVRQILDMNAFQAQKNTALQHNVARRLSNAGASSVLFYRDPIEMVSARGVWMTDKNGINYLDFYNNVPCVGHCHPKVIEAVSHQLAKLNTNTRYIVSIVDDYTEALKATFPAELSNVVLTCSGSEANDLAMRLACKATGGTGFIVTECAYHGNTAYVSEVSPSSIKSGKLPDHVVTVPPPSRQIYGNDIQTGFAKSVHDAIETLKQRGIQVAALLLDSIFSSDGVFAQPGGFLADAVEAIHQAGGVYIADEVQPGFARMGEVFWGFESHGVVPDIVTLGKPMGNGFPMAGVVTRPDYLERFCQDTGYFNTFGGNPVAAAAGLAVLNIIKEERLQENAYLSGTYLKQALMRIAEESPYVGEVRGVGLFLGIDLVMDGQPNADFTTKVIDRLRDANILVGAAGPHGSTLKLRPPLSLSRVEADFFIRAFAEAVQPSLL